MTMLHARWFRAVVLLFSLLLAGMAMGQQGLLLKPDARVAVVGDSITEQKIYSRFIELYLMACRPDLNARVMQFGWGGETAPGFAGRMANDMFPFKPTLVTTCYGMNDGGYRAFDAGIGKRYEDAMRDIVKRAKEAGAVVLVGSPGAVDAVSFRRDPKLAAVYNDNLAHLGEIAKKVADEQGMPFADVHTPMMDAMTKAKAANGEEYLVCGGDGVHPGPNGHLLMAYAFLKGMGFDGNLGTITVDLKGDATATDGHKVLAAKDGKVELESTRYPFCFFGGLKDANGTVSILPFTPFLQELDRLTLVVKNAPADMMKVTWGKESKVYQRADLERGVNLAADFLDNPFVPAFRNVEVAIARKQDYETRMIKSIINPLGSVARDAKDDPEVLAALVTIRKFHDKTDDRLYQDALKLMVPVKHTLLIEAAPIAVPTPAVAAPAK